MAELHPRHLLSLLWNRQPVTTHPGLIEGVLDQGTSQEGVKTHNTQTKWSYTDSQCRGFDLRLWLWLNVKNQGSNFEINIGLVSEPQVLDDLQRNLNLFSKTNMHP